MKKILLVNDDGYSSPGLRALLPVLSRDFELTVVAPASQKSWIGKASSYQQQIQCEKIDVDGFSVYTLEGTPADCTSAGIYHLCGERPDMVISGINAGANVGDSYILSSGTVGGAVEAALAGIPAVAVGVEFDFTHTRKIEFEPGHEDLSLFSFAASITRALALGFFSAFSRTSVPPGMIFNLNMSMEADWESEIEITTPARYSYGPFLRPSEKGFYHTGAPKHLETAEPGTDMAAMRDGKISLSPVSFLSAACFRGTEERFLQDLLVCIKKLK